MGFNIYVIIACLLLLCFLAYHEIRRPNKHWLGARLAAILIAVLTFALMVIPLTINREVKQRNTQLNVITDGFDADSLNAISHQKYFVDETLASQLKREARFIPDLAYHLALHPEIKKLSVFGYGLADEELKKLGNIPIEFHPAKKPSGIIACHWKDQLKEGETLIVQGQYRNTSLKIVDLKLIGFGKTLDSAKISANAMFQFSLQHQLRQKGQALLKLVALQGKDTLNQEDIPVQTLAKNALKVVVLGSSPSFEYNFLKRWLYENQYALALRNRISKDKYNIEFLNRNSTEINRLNIQSLQKEDVLLIDQQEFENITAPEKQAIKQAVAQGLGLVILVQESISTEPWIKSLNLIASKKQEKINPLLLNQQQIKLAVLPEQVPLLIGSASDQQALVSDGPLAVAIQKLYGKGKMVASTLPNTYQWNLMGHQQNYSLYWSTLFEAASRSAVPKYSLQIKSDVPKTMNRINFSLATPTSAIPAIHNGQQTLSSKQNMLFDNRWQFQYWPTNSGWKSLTIDGQQQHFFVFGKEKWQALNANQRLEYNTAYALSHPSSNHLPETTLVIKKTISKWWFFIAFAFASGFLWLESRLYNRN